MWTRGSRRPKSRSEIGRPLDEISASWGTTQLVPRAQPPNTLLLSGHFFIWWAFKHLPMAFNLHSLDYSYSWVASHRFITHACLPLIKSPFQVFAHSQQGPFSPYWLVEVLVHFCMGCQVKAVQNLLSLMIHRCLNLPNFSFVFCDFWIIRNSSLLYSCEDILLEC